jgi:hypothetical protein
MTDRLALSPEVIPVVSAVERALAFGIDITLLIENLRYSPTERVQQAQAMLDAVVALQAEVKAWRGRQVRSG